MKSSKGYILALDVGEKRVGVAIASSIAKIAQPFKTLENTEHIWDDLKNLIHSENISVIVVGLPRNLESQDTQQTVYARSFAKKLQDVTNIKPVMQDEALTSRQAEAELRARGKNYVKGDIDALAATYILSDYLVTIDAVEKRI